MAIVIDKSQRWRVVLAHLFLIGLCALVIFPLVMVVSSYHEIPAIVDVAAPVYLKFAVRNCAPLYPAGEHLRGVVLSSSRERVRRAAIGLELLAAAGKSFKGSP